MALVLAIVVFAGGAACVSDRTAGALAARPLPDLPGDLALDCPDPGVRVGYPLRSELKRNRNWAKCEREKNRDKNAFYSDLQAAR
ncbi:hypothetical protein OSH11_13900 [Kaistia dalseonensis]|uniref:Uncharacterized protein n=1 Tax=Kaistia dalseonensis TaxID=410840 RepID=A0ABU0HA82_9HYPH|nr:hypothetical protein [Kaistia dalseonensis]MCX5495803.1 hypothetical protein [Kaistia dalseonensis]MDQ0438404.1 hypothetical protein [Kaistia dalseonensis]